MRATEKISAAWPGRKGTSLMELDIQNQLVSGKAQAMRTVEGVKGLRCLSVGILIRARAVSRTARRIIRSAGV